MSTEWIEVEIFGLAPYKAQALKGDNEIGICFGKDGTRTVWLTPENFRLQPDRGREDKFRFSLLIQRRVAEILFLTKYEVNWE